MGRRQILLVEDNPGDILLTQKAIEKCALSMDLTVKRDGEEALAYLQAEDTQLPQLILLDLNLPRVDGREVLKVVKASAQLRHIPVIVLTSSEAAEDIACAYREHCNCFITKPIKMGEFVRIMQTIESFWFTTVKLSPGETSK